MIAVLKRYSYDNIETQANNKMMCRSSSTIPIPKSNTPRSNINQRSSNDEVAKYNDIRMYELIVSGMLEQMKRRQCTNGTVHPMSEKSLRGILRTSLTRYEDLEPSYFDEHPQPPQKMQQQKFQYCDQDETKQEDDNDWIFFSVDSSWEHEHEVSCINFDAKTSINYDNNYCLYSMTSEDSNDSMSSTRRSESSISESMMQLPSLGEDEERHGDDCNDCVFILEL
jgi:hypothetical protein